MSRKRPPKRNIFSMRLKEVRQQQGLSQKTLGIKAGIDEFVAGTRINRYEKGIHQPNITISENIANVLDLPLAYFFAEDDRLAKMIASFSHLTAGKQKELLSATEEMLKTE